MPWQVAGEGGGWMFGFGNRESGSRSGGGLEGGGAFFVGGGGGFEGGEMGLCMGIGIGIGMGVFVWRGRGRCTIDTTIDKIGL